MIATKSTAPRGVPCPAWQLAEKPNEYTCASGAWCVRDMDGQIVNYVRSRQAWVLVSPGAVTFTRDAEALRQHEEL